MGTMEDQFGILLAGKDLCHVPLFHRKGHTFPPLSKYHCQAFGKEVHHGIFMKAVRPPDQGRGFMGIYRSILFVPIQGGGKAESMEKEDEVAAKHHQSPQDQGNPKVPLPRRHEGDGVGQDHDQRPAGGGED